jgi:hypothetical protein
MRHTIGYNVSRVCLSVCLSVFQVGVAAVSSTHGFRRADGCSGSAIKGVKVLSTRPQCQDAEVQEGRAVGVLQPEVGESFSILSAGYDQRLSIWRPHPSILNVSQPHYSQSLCHSFQGNIKTANASPTPIDQHTDGPFMDSKIVMQERDSLLEWRAGMAIHVGDVCALDALTMRTRDPYQRRCVADSVPALLDSNSTLHRDDRQTKRGAQAPESETSETAIIVVGEGYQVFTTVLQNHNNTESCGSR